MKCPNCNHENEKNAKFCGNCGQTLISTNKIIDQGISVKGNKTKRRKRIIRGFAIAACCLVVAIVVGVGVVHLRYLDAESYDDGTVWIDKKAIICGEEGSNSEVVSFDNNSVTLKAKDSQDNIGTNYDIGKLSNESFLVSGYVDQSSYGFLRKVKSSSKKSDGTIKVETEQAALTDVIKECDISFGAALDGNNKPVTQTVNNKKTTVVTSGFVQEAYADEQKALPSGDEDKKKGFKLRPTIIPELVKCEAGMGFDGHIKIDWGVADVEVKVNPYLTVGVDLKLGLKLSKSDHIELFNEPLIKVMAGPVPIWVNLALNLNASAGVSVKGLSMYIESTFSKVIGFKYNTWSGGQGILEDNSSGPNVSFHPSDEYCTIGSSCSVGLSIKLKLYDLAGIEAGIDLKRDDNLNLRPLGPGDPPNDCFKIAGFNTPLKGYRETKTTIPIYANGVFGKEFCIFDHKFGEIKIKIANTDDAITLNDEKEYHPESEKPKEGIDDKDYGEKQGNIEKRQLIDGEFMG